ncbi:hypothetical protein BI292_25685 [Pseudomonas sp. 43NM1]|uniref:type IV toxin-antitoxin system AbiEi family antitoxin n=1 Tax=Pseudomonas sp. 43NM1 TaxID=1904755 RepID=UPI000C32EAB4|nr:type IV toxin-antitoxin system AbiEi family antitoxin [Pseudomonas sp. 43NM1]PKH36158.1 hypothetical protein BI292_25685 [Pseudomonas sp. 43NM1]
MPNEFFDQARQPLIEGFIESLQNATGAKVLHRRHAAGIDRGVDLLLTLDTPDGNWDVAVEIKRAVYPRDIRDALEALQRYGAENAEKRNATTIIPMVIAEKISQGAREELKNSGAGYYDASGSLYFRHERWLINIDRPAAASARKTQRVPLFSGAKEMVVHALLHSKGEWFTGLELAERSETSVFTVSSVLQELELREWVESEGSGRLLRRRLCRAGDLLDAWAEAWQQRKENRSNWYFFSSNPRQLLENLARKAPKSSSASWAFTGAIAANYLSPLLTQVDLAELETLPGTQAQLADALGLKPAEKGNNVVLIERSGAGMLFRRHDPQSGAWLASEFIQYLDLQDGRGRNAELATQLRHDILKV